ncbi:MAG TPA: hypothetical protein VFI15_05370 [Candidatus Limnocylindrales bacterium]|nr:hypothetical protein [Candidatus Limnocylindrales bacterium]
MTSPLFDQYKDALRRGHVAALAGDLDDALDAYREAARLVPERTLPIASQGTVLHRMDRWAEAADAFDLALQMAPDDESALRARARARDERGLRSGAAADYERLAFVLDIAGRAPDAAEAARRAARLEPSPARDALADRLQLAAAQQADLQPALAPRSFGGIQVAELDVDEDDAASTADELDEPAPDDDLIDEPQATQASLALAARIAELGTQPKWVDMDGRSIGEDGGVWPAIDLPSMPDELVEGPRPDPETLLAVAVDLLESGDVQSARDLMLTAVMVHREEGRVDAAIEICLRLLAAAPGDPKVHLAIANLQLDRGWTAVATEKIELLKRLTALTGDTQAEADVHYLASERLREGLPT